VADRDARGGTLVLGGGFAGSYVARLLGKRGATVVSLENFMLYTPMLPEAASGTLEPRHVVVPLRMMCPHADLVIGRATTHDAARRRVQVETGEGLLNLR
jgi:NADH:quinone reductase (non-electrogenic)